VAEWPIAAVLKTAVGQPTVGSNPTSSAISFSIHRPRVSFHVMSRAKPLCLMDKFSFAIWTYSSVRILPKHRAAVQQLSFSNIFLLVRLELCKKAFQGMKQALQSLLLRRWTRSPKLCKNLSLIF
jgi:hypothetical protein